MLHCLTSCSCHVMLCRVTLRYVETYKLYRSAPDFEFYVGLINLLSALPYKTRYVSSHTILVHYKKEKILTLRIWKTKLNVALFKKRKLMLCDVDGEHPGVPQLLWKLRRSKERSLPDRRSFRRSQYGNGSLLHSAARKRGTWYSGYV